MDNQEKTLKARYGHLEADRAGTLALARECAKLTIPSLLPDNETTKQEYPTPKNGIGPKGVVYLASKLLMALYPPNGAWFRFGLSEEAQEEAESQGTLSEAKSILSKIERHLLRFDESKNSRSIKFEAIKHLIVTGNIGLFTDKEGKTRLFPLNTYVVVRSPNGEMIELIIKESVKFIALPEEIRMLISEDEGSEKYKDDDDVDIYTGIHLKEDGKYHVTQEALGKPIDSAKGSYMKESCPYLALRWNSSTVSDYGIGHIENELGNFRSLEAIREALLDYAGAASKVIFLIRDGATIKIKSIQKARSGDFVRGNRDDVDVLTLDKIADFKVLKDLGDDIYRGLAHSFLMNSSVQRDAERVTAEEVRIVASELEDALGGVYSLLTQEWQLPHLRRLMKISDVSKEIPNGTVEPTIIAGMAALGRGHEDAKISEAIYELKQAGIEPADVFNLQELAMRKLQAKGVETEGIVKTPEQRQQELQQEQMAQMAQNVAPTVAKEAMAQGE